MEQLRSKLAVVTGASAGIGAAIVKDLLAAGMIVVGLARRVERIEQLRRSLPPEQQERLHPLHCDVTAESEVAATFTAIVAQHGAIHVLINNAGCLRCGQLCHMDASVLQQVWQTNVMGVVHCTRYAFSIGGMQQHGVGQVVLINSILGSRVPSIAGHLPALNIYPATKYALTAINEIYRQEFKELGTRVKVTSINPGLVDTEFMTEQQKSIAGASILQPADVSQAVMFALTVPAHVHVFELTIKPLGELF